MEEKPRPKRRPRRRGHRKPSDSAADTSTRTSTRKPRLEPVASGAFFDLGLNPRLCAAVRKAGYEDPTPIQSAAIPVVMEGVDLMGGAQTGTGKTAAFALPILHRLLEEGETRPRNPRALVLAPTRELAAQIGDSFEAYAEDTDIRHAVIFGGVGKGPQIERLRARPAVLVATPGRLLDLMGDDHIRLDDVEVFVLDEADRMLDMGFVHDVRRVGDALPDERQTLLFSATLEDEVEKLAGRLLHAPRKISVDPVSTTREPISQAVRFVGRKEKMARLIELMNEESIERAIVFTRTKHRANRVAKGLVAADIEAAAIHGNKSQGARERALGGFRAGEIRALVATDIAARGIDIEELPWVINFELPNEPEVYVHRVGRTGRAGRSGRALSFCDAEERDDLRGIERLIRKKLDRPWGEPAPTAEAEEGAGATSAAPRGRGGRGGTSAGGPRRKSTRKTGRAAKTAKSPESESSRSRSSKPARKKSSASAGSPARKATAKKRSTEARPRTSGNAATDGDRTGSPSGRRRPPPRRGSGKTSARTD